VFIWDIDKTYLSTHFSSLRGLSRIPVEFAIDKQAIVGMPEVLRGIRKGPGPGYRCAPLYFVTASPPQIRKALEHRMLLDGVEHDGITFKDWWGLLQQRRPRRILDQVGFKLCALLAGRSSRPMATEFLFGDDAEIDAEAFSLYAKLIHGEFSAGDAAARLMEAGVRKDNRRCVFVLFDRLPQKRGTVGRIFIHLERGTPPSHFERFGDLLTPVRNAFQLSLALFELGLIDEDSVRQCREAIAAKPKGTHRFRDAAPSGGGSSKPDLEACVTDALERGLISSKKASLLPCSNP
jgi:hypothetical protein